MNKYSGYETCRAPQVPFAELVAPADDLAAAILSIFTGMTRFIGSKIRHWRQEMVISHTASELSRLSDHTLGDIGIHRADIYRVARMAVEDPRADIRGAPHHRG